MFGRSRVRRVSPDRLLLASHGQARLRVEGTVYGFIRVERERRWAWGDFDETFVVALPERAPALLIRLSGLSGLVRHPVPCGPKIDLRSPALTRHKSTLRVQVRLPRTRSLAVRRILAPRLEPLARVPIQSASTATESTS